jgi:hypothetical protein
MYEFVTDAEISKYRKYCSEMLKQLVAALRPKGIKAQFFLVGSGARNMVMRNGDGPFDLDYNLRILSMTDEYRKDLCKLKSTVRIALNRIAKDTLFSDGQDSTSVITVILQDGTNKFKFDLAILAENSKGNLCRLIHDKYVVGQNVFHWDEVPDSHNVKAKADAIKNYDKWSEVREKYAEQKNRYLRFHDENHPSFVCYVEAVNMIYQRYFRD